MPDQRTAEERIAEYLYENNRVIGGLTISPESTRYAAKVFAEQHPQIVEFIDRLQSRIDQAVEVLKLAGLGAAYDPKNSRKARIDEALRILQEK